MLVPGVHKAKGVPCGLKPYRDAMFPKRRNQRIEKVPNFGQYVGDGRYGLENTDLGGKEK
jgi:hypothetical protein